MIKTSRHRKKLDWHYTRFGGVLTVICVKLWARIFLKTDYKISLRSLKNSSNETVIIASNHQTLMDAPVVFSALSLRDLISISPAKFMTWHKYYNSKFKFAMYSTGCFPSHGEGNTGVEGALYYANNNYQIFIFPEGKRTQPQSRKPAYTGVSKIIEGVENPRLLLAHIEWEKRTKLLSRPTVSVHWSEAPKNIDKTNPDKIMDAIYSL